MKEQEGTEKELNQEEQANISSDELQEEQAEINELDEEVEEAAKDQSNNAEDELAQLKDKHLRLQAEFDNFRRRTMKEKAEIIKAGGEQVLKNIIPVIDDLDRAMDAFKEMEDHDPLKQGIILIHNKFSDFLKQNNLVEIDAAEKDFDTDLHEAITKIPAPTEELKGKVVDVIQKGYMLHDKVVRYAKVVIGE